MISRAFRRTVQGIRPKVFRANNYTIRVSRERDVTYATAHVDNIFHHVLINSCWGLTALGTTAAFYQFVTNLHTVPITGRTQVVVFNLEDDTEIGNQHAQESLKGQTLITTGPRFKMVKDVATRLVAVADKIFEPGYHWQVYLIQDPQINACCFMGGKIFVYTGLLDFIDSMVQEGICSNKYNALATVLGHEIAHALARHTAETLSYLPLVLSFSVLTVDSELISSLFKYLCQLPFSRMHEKEADHIGLMLMAAACYDPSEASKFWDGMRLVNENTVDWFSTHPADDKRQRHLEELTHEALAYQEKASWCGDMKSKVSRLIFKRVTRRAATAGKTHAAEMTAIWDGLNTVSEKK